MDFEQTAFEKEELTRVSEDFNLDNTSQNLVEKLFYEYKQKSSSVVI